MSRSPHDHQPEYTDAEQHKSFVGRRLDAFADRSREPGDAATWATVLGALMWTLLVICYSVADLPLIALVMLGLTFVWIGIMARFGGVNVFSILWGSAATDANKPANDFVVAQSSAVVALISVVALVIDTFTGAGFRWYGIALLLTVAVYAVVYIRTWLLPARKL